MAVDPVTEYVTNAAWLRTTGRPDAIDEIADAFERRPEPAEQAWVRPLPTRWPERPRDWRADRRAG
ncbi:hypothetical protein [Jatrophihabitans fulvus]